MISNNRQMAPNIHNILSTFPKILSTDKILSKVLWMLIILHLTQAIKIPLRHRREIVREHVFSKDSSYLTEEGNLKGKPGQGYYAEMQVGTPPQKMNVLVDTGSSNFAIACSPDPSIKTFFHTDDSSSYTSDGRTVKVPYTQGKWEGPVGQDMVRMSSLKNVSAVESYIACITTSDQFFINGSHWEGILGLAYSEIARPDNSVEPFFDTLVRERDVPNLFSMQLCGTLDKNKQTDVSMGGSMVIGAIDPDLYKGEIFYTPLRKEWYYEVVVTDIQVEGHSLAMDCKEYNFDKTIVDSGTTNLRLPTKVFTQLVESIKKKTLLADKDPPPDEFWSGSSVLCWSTGVTPWDEFPSISIHLAKTNNSTFSLVLSPQQYLRAVGEEYDPSAQEDCFKFAVAPSITGMVLGAVLMEGFYIIFDRENQQIGFAQSSCNVRNPKGVISRVEGPFTTRSNVQDCAYIKPENNQSTMITVAYVLAGVCGACMIPLILMLVQWIWQKIQNQRNSQDDTNTLISDDEDNNR